MITKFIISFKASMNSKINPTKITSATEKYGQAYKNILTNKLRYYFISTYNL